MADILRRKSEHLDIVLRGDVQPRSVGTGFDQVQFEHLALPEVDLQHIDLSTEFLGHRIAAPLLISSMTGGPEAAERINRALAEAAAALGIAFAVGSQRVALSDAGAGGFEGELRRLCARVPLLANLGAAQLAGDDGHDLALRAVEMIEADALIIHLNPLQEAVQPGGDRDWRGLFDRIAELARTAPVPLVVKEVGCGVSAGLARRLAAAGVAAIDVAGAGGTSWAAVEAQRAADERTRRTAEVFRDWGIPTAAAVAQVREACPDAVVIASGGVRHGLDVARAIRLGADLAGQAAGVLKAATEGTAPVIEHFSGVIDQLRIACFCTGSADLKALRRAQLQRPSAGNPW